MVFSVQIAVVCRICSMEKGGEWGSRETQEGDELRRGRMWRMWARRKFWERNWKGRYEE